MEDNSHGERRSAYRGIPDSLANAIRVLLLALPHIKDDQINLVFRILEDQGDQLPIRIEEDDKLLSLAELSKELGKSRQTVWRMFQEDPDLKKKLLSGYVRGHPQYSLSKVRIFKAGILN